MGALSVEPSAEWLWKRIERALDDRTVLDAEHVVSYRALLTSLAARIHRSGELVG